MKITILAVGSHGDVQPIVALGQGLVVAGHEVCIAASARFETLVRNYGLDFSLIQIDTKEVFESDAGKAGLESGNNPVKSFRNFARVLNPIVQQMGADCLAACQGADVIIHTTQSFYFGPSIAETLNLPHIVAFLQPQHPTRAFPGFLSPIQRSLGGPFNQFTRLLTDLMLWLPYRSAFNQWRQEQLKLPPIGINYFKWKQVYQMDALYGFSPNVIPKPPDWGNNIEITGYWFLNDSANWEAPYDLLDFLEAGPPPVYVGFGSMTNRNPEETTNLVLEAFVRTKQRGLLLTGWGGLKKSDLPDNVFKVEYAPHDWLFPQMAAIVHHGGAGTTGASLRSGIPTVVVPFFYDQYFWGQQVVNLGVGPKPIPRKKLSVERLAMAITTAVTNKEMQKRAANLGKQIQTEDGVTRAVKFINGFLSKI